jgi:hypothetical protein
VSITFSEYQKENPSKAGYFRIGFIVLAVPPTDIRTDKIVNNERLTTLRGRNDMVKKTGQARWDVTVSFKVLLGDPTVDDANYYKQWEDFRSILAMFHAAPFVEVENGFIRQALCLQDSTLSSARMAFALRQMNVRSSQDSIDTLDIDLTMSLFNYFPYTKDFGYLGDKKQGVDAWQSPAFQSYIENWKAKNLDGSTINEYDGSPLPNWKDQFDGTVKLKWREYTTIKLGTAVATGTSAPAVTALAAQTQNNTNVPVIGAGSSTAVAAAARLAAAAASLVTGIPAELIFGQWGFETGGFKNRGARELNNLAGVRIVNTTTYRTFSSIADFGNYYSRLMTGPRYRAAISMMEKTANGLATALKSRGYFESDPIEYGRGIALWAKQYGTVTPAPVPLPPGVAVKPATATKPAALVQTTAPAGAPGDTITADQLTLLQKLLTLGYQYDHSVNEVAFFYREQEMTLSDTDHGDQDNFYGLFSSGINVLFVNNLAQIPLAGYSYPTYQHIGSTSAKVILAFSSVGTQDSETDEPQHPGISAISGASEFLDAQYLQYRNTWRAVSSVHRMQAFYIENKLANMMGIRGLMIDRISNQTVPSSSNLAICEVSGIQYENVFEVSTPYKINSSSAQAVQTAQAVVISGALSSLTPDETNVMPEVSQFAKGRAAADMLVLNSFLIKLAGNSGTDFGSFATLPTATLTTPQIAALLSPYTGTTRNLSAYQPIVKRLKTAQSSNVVTIGDLALVAAVASGL